VYRRGHSEFRVERRTFASLGGPADTVATLNLTPEKQSVFMHAAPMFFVSGVWVDGGGWWADGLHAPRAATWCVKVVGRALNLHDGGVSALVSMSRVSSRQRSCSCRFLSGRRPYLPGASCRALGSRSFAAMRIRFLPSSAASVKWHGTANGSRALRGRHEQPSWEYIGLRQDAGGLCRHHRQIAHHHLPNAPVKGVALCESLQRNARIEGGKQWIRGGGISLWYSHLRQ
jgi:hypothetical protein